MRETVEMACAVIMVIIEIVKLYRGFKKESEKKSDSFLLCQQIRRY